MLFQYSQISYHFTIKSNQIMENIIKNILMQLPNTLTNI